MKRINPAAVKELDNLITRLEEGEFDKLYLPWAVLRRDERTSTKEHWKDLVYNLIENAKKYYRCDKDQNRFYIDSHMNMQVQVIVLAWYESKPFETTSSLLISLH